MIYIFVEIKFYSPIAYHMWPSEWKLTYLIMVGYVDM